MYIYVILHPHIDQMGGTHCLETDNLDEWVMYVILSNHYKNIKEELYTNIN